VDAHGLSRRSADEEFKLFGFSWCDLFFGTKLTPAQLALIGEIEKHVIPVNRFDHFGPVVSHLHTVHELITTGLVLMNLGREGGISARILLCLSKFCADASSLGVRNSLLVSRAHSHFVKVFNRAAERILLPVNSLLAPAKLDDCQT
jgi:hypothetical protein